MTLIRKIATSALLFSVLQGTQAQELPLSEALSRAAMHKWKDSFALDGRQAKWSYDLGVILKGMEGVYKSTGNVDYFNYIKKSMDFYVAEDGTVKLYNRNDFNIDLINNGKNLLFLYQVTGQEKYRKAVAYIRTQLNEHPRTKEGGFWHKKVYPWQMWLDGLYMGQPFYAEYAKVFNEPESFSDITRQFVLMEKNARDAKTGLLYHGYDESREQKWADKTTGQSPHFWSRALGWYGMALVDALDHFPADHPGKDSLIAILNRFSTAVVKYQYPANGLWYQVTDRPEEKGNYPEASGSCMITYTLAKALRKGYIPEKFRTAAEKAYAGIRKEFIHKGAEGYVYLSGTVSVAGLGGKPYRDGSYAYYLSEKVIDNDPKGMGAFILCSFEMENAAYAAAAGGKGTTILLDHYFNNEFRTTPDKRQTPYHYILDEQDNGGYSLLAAIVEKNGAAIRELTDAPTKKNLKGAKAYIIVDPDTKAETAAPNYIDKKAQREIKNWVKSGGVLVLMANDKGNCEFEHLNELAGIFGITFNEDSHNRVQKNIYEQGKITVPAGNPVLKPGDIFIKEYASINVKTPATKLLEHEGRTVMALSKYGKGTVLAIGDPWIYNEYIDGRRLPVTFRTYAAAEDLVKWLIGKHK